MPAAGAIAWLALGALHALLWAGLLWKVGLDRREELDGYGNPMLHWGAEVREKLSELLLDETEEQDVIKLRRVFGALALGVGPTLALCAGASLAGGGAWAAAAIAAALHLPLVAWAVQTYKEGDGTARPYGAEEGKPWPLRTPFRESRVFAASAYTRSQERPSARTGCRGCARRGQQIRWTHARLPFRLRRPEANEHCDQGSGEVPEEEKEREADRRKGVLHLQLRELRRQSLGRLRQPPERHLAGKGGGEVWLG